MVVAVPILLGVPPPFVRLIPSMMAAPAFPTLGVEVLAGFAGLSTPFSVARNGALKLLLSLLDVVLALGAVFVGSRRSGAGTQKNGAQCCAGKRDFSVLCIQGFLPERVAEAPGKLAMQQRQSCTCARSPLRFSDWPLGCAAESSITAKKSPVPSLSRQNGAFSFRRG